MTAIREKNFVAINGARQGIFLRGADSTNPVLLWLHGGLPDTFLAWRFPNRLEQHVTIAWWEMRGSGISFQAADQPLTAEQLIADTIAMSDHLRDRFGQDRIFLAGHSGGSFIGIQAAARAPDRYAAYIGVAQMADQLRSEMLAHAYMVEAFRRLGDRSMVRRLLAAPVTAENGTPRAYLALRDVAMHRLGIGTMREMRSIIRGLIIPSLLYPDYTLREKVNLWRAKARSGVSALWGEMLATPLAEVVPELITPAYFLHGIHDYTCAYSVARDFAGRLRAPVKGFYTFTRSAHCPNFEEPERTVRIFTEDILVAGTGHADPPPLSARGRDRQDANVEPAGTGGATHGEGQGERLRLL